MEVLGILFGIIFWPAAIIGWLLLCHVTHVKRQIRNTILAILVLLPLLAAYSMGRYLFLDEPLCIAAGNGNVAKVRALLRWGASPNAEFEGTCALRSAVENGHAEVVKLLLARGARPEGRGVWQDRSLLELARATGRKDIERLLTDAGARQ